MVSIKMMGKMMVGSIGQKCLSCSNAFLFNQTGRGVYFINELESRVKSVL